jgi:bacteriorhodopsin
MQRKTISTPAIIKAVLILGLIPLLIFPPDAYSPNSQEWWLPVLLAFFSMVAFVQLVFRHSVESWPWYLISFAQGFNIISRLMMLMPHATTESGGNVVFNTLYVVLTLLSIALSVVLLWYTELPEVRQGLLRDLPNR